MGVVARAHRVVVVSVVLVKGTIARMRARAAGSRGWSWSTAVQWGVVVKGGVGVGLKLIAREG